MSQPGACGLRCLTGVDRRNKPPRRGCTADLNTQGRDWRVLYVQLGPFIMSLTKDTVQSGCLACCDEQAEIAVRLSVVANRLREGRSARAAHRRMLAKMWAVHRESNRWLAVAFGLPAPERHASGCDLVAGRRLRVGFGCGVGIHGLIGHPVKMTETPRPWRLAALVTHSYPTPAEILNRDTKQGLVAELLPATSGNPQRHIGTTGAILTVDREGAR